MGIMGEDGSDGNDGRNTDGDSRLTAGAIDERLFSLRCRTIIQAETQEGR
jgi:hypothetical protein